MTDINIEILKSELFRLSVRVEGMKAENRHRELNDKWIFYTRSDFHAVEKEVFEIIRQLHIIRER